MTAPRAWQRMLSGRRLDLLRLEPRHYPDVFHPSAPQGRDVPRQQAASAEAQQGLRSRPLRPIQTAADTRGQDEGMRRWTGKRR